MAYTMFKVKELRDLYEKCLQEFGYEIEINERNLKIPFLVTLKTLVYKNNQTERTKYLFFQQAYKNC